MKWEVKIEKTVNGYYVSADEELEFENFVIEEPETDNPTRDEQVGFKDLCLALKEVFGINNDKHNNQYLDITVSNIDD